MEPTQAFSSILFPKLILQAWGIKMDGSWVTYQAALLFRDTACDAHAVSASRQPHNPTLFPRELSMPLYAVLPTYKGLQRPTSSMYSHLSLNPTLL